LTIDPVEYERRVRDTVWKIVTDEYEAYERDLLNPRAQHFVGMRPFWRGFVFDEATTEGSHPSTELVLRFHDEVFPERRYGFREGIWNVVTWWEEYGPPSNMPEDPERLAHELVFIMVYVISEAPSELFGDDAGTEVNWLTGGAAWAEVVTADGTRIPLVR
jgi:hypothetical protein